MDNINYYEKFLNRSIFAFPIIIVIIGVFLVSLTFFLILNKYQKLELKNIRNDLLKEKKLFLKNSVMNTNEDAKILMYTLIEREKEKIKLDIYTISQVILSIYNNYNGDAHQFIINVLNSVNKVRSRHYFGVINFTNKKMIVHPIKKVVNKNVHNILVNGKPLDEVVSKTINNPLKEGYFSVKFYKPNDKKLYKKIIFVKYIKPLNFAIGTGEYLDEIIKIVKKEIIQKILLKKGNYSVIDFENKKIYSNNKITDFSKVDKNYLSKILNIRNEKYISYKVKNSQKYRNKLSYVVYNKDLNLIIEKGIYLDEINKFIQKRYDRLNIMYNELYKALIISVIVVLIFCIFISLLIFKKLKIIKNIFLTKIFFY